MSVYAHPDATALVQAALLEDLRFGDDLTCRAVVPPMARLSAVVRAKAPGVLCGLPLAETVFAQLGGGVDVTGYVDDGTVVQTGDVVLTCHGRADILLKGERTFLNFAQRLSGTATLARRYVEAVAGTGARILDTRKTTPGLRLLQKHAVAAGGAHNHRIGLYDQVLIKDNHIALMGADEDNGPAEAVRRCRAVYGSQAMIEVEIEDLDDLDLVIDAGASIVLLDNMGVDLLRRAVALRSTRPVLLEASGGITLATVRAIAETGVDRISTGELTHSAPALDLSMRCTPLAG